MTQQQKHNNFERVIVNRVINIVNDITSLKNMTNKSFYSYTKEEQQKLIQIMKDSLSALERHLEGGFHL